MDMRFANKFIVTIFLNVLS